MKKQYTVTIINTSIIDFRKTYTSKKEAIKEARENIKYLKSIQNVKNKNNILCIIE